MQRGRTTEGFVLVTVLAMAVLIGVILVVASTFAIAARQTVTAEAQKIPAFYAANAGLERSMATISSLITPGQVLTGTATKYADATTLQVAEDLSKRLATYDNLVKQGTVAGGKFTVTPTYQTGKSEVQLKSVGTGDTGGSRTILLSYLITASTLKDAAASAFSTTGHANVTGDAHITGSLGSVNTAGSTITCTVATGTVSNCSSPPSPAVYKVTWPLATLPNLNDSVTYTPDPVNDPNKYMQDAMYKVTAVNKTTGEVELTAVNEIVNVATTTTTGKKTTTTITPTSVPLKTGSKLSTTTEVAAILSYKDQPAPSGNAKDSCTVYACGYLSTSPDKLFEATFGITKTKFKSDLTDSTLTKALTTSDVCPSGATDSKVQWLSPSIPNSGILDLVDCNTPRVLVIDLPAFCLGKNNCAITVKLNNAGFKGLLYVIGNDQALRIEGNGGSFAGAVIAETGTKASGNPEITVTGNAKTGYCASGDAKICFDATILNNLYSEVKKGLDSSALPSMSDLANSWKEIKGS